MGHPSCFSSWDLDMDGCRRWCITALATDSWSRSSLRLSVAEQLSQAMLAYSRRGRSIVLYSRDIVSTLTRARYPSVFRAAAFGAALFNMPDTGTWSDHFSVEARVKPRWETVHTCCSLSPVAYLGEGLGGLQMENPAGGLGGAVKIMHFKAKIDGI